jgi:hypothetical protein
MDQDHAATSEFDVASQAYIGRWNRLISTTNWEKGRIIHEWRAALQAAGAATTEYSDESWSRVVGSVSGQHVGRLRRVYERFGDVFEEYEGLFWSHFQAALDWDDAEMWLEGALQNDWSVSAMRKQRWEALGAVHGNEPQDSEIVMADLDEDVRREDDPAGGAADQKSIVVADDEFVSEARSPAGPDFGDEDDVPRASRHKDDSGASIYADHEAQAVPFVRPFENLAELPDDVADAFEAFKLAILRHKAIQWEEISQEDLLAALDALKEFVQAPASDEA